MVTFLYMSKRGAEKPLDYDNWDSPDEPPAPSVFEQADEATLKSRKMIHVSKKTQPITQSRRGIFKSLDAFGTIQTKSQSTSITSSPERETTDSSFLSKLATLNKEVSAWISKHVDEDPYCILTPIFNDYAKHLTSIESTKMESKTEKSYAPSFPPFSEITGVAPIVPNFTAIQSTSSGSNGFNFSFKPSMSSDLSSTTKPPTFSFGLSAANTSNSSSLSSNPPSFSFKADLNKPTENFTSIPGSFSTAPISNAEQGDEEEYVPPKPEVKEVKEEGSVYTVR